MIRLISPSPAPDELRLRAMLDVGHPVEMPSRAGQRRCKGKAIGMEYAASASGTRWVAVLWDDDPQPEWVDAVEICKPGGREGKDATK